MATDRDSPSTTDPAADYRTRYDYESDDVDRPALVRDLERLIEGEARADSYSRQLYATDASIYEMTPIAVVFPRSTEDVSAVVSYCAERSIPVLPRGGGTSLAGQTVNEAVVIDFSRYMTDVIDIDPSNRTVTAQPGIYLGTLNEALSSHGLKFAPDPAWGDKSALGGAIGNNSTGAHSLAYGKTDAYVESVEVVLADGTITRFGTVDVTDLETLAAGDDLEARVYAEVLTILEEKAELIEATYPELKRNVSGYNLDWLVAEARGRTGTAAAELDATDVVAKPDGATDAEAEHGGVSEITTDSDDPVADGTVNVGKLLCGSEGTLAVVTEATVSLEPIPGTKGMALLAYDTVLDAMADVAPIVEHDPAAVEVLDDVLLDLARNSAEFAPVTEQVPDGTGAVLIVEFYATDDADAKRRVARLLGDRLAEFEPDGVSTPDSAGERFQTDAEILAFDAIEAYDSDSRAKIWKLRKSGLPILLSRTTDEKHVAFIEDTAVPPEHLRDYVSDFQAVLEAHDTYASFYAHAGPGVLHIRPLVHTKTEAGIEQMESIADDVTDLVVEYGGSVSGEHGDGRARTQWNRKLYGEELWETFESLKTAFDPEWLLNPGQVVYRDENPTDMTENHRFGPDYAFESGFDPVLSWENDQGFEGMVELCHGCGGCRGNQSTTGGVMCPTFRASREEITSTRGRANALRQAMSGDLPSDEVITDEFVSEVLDLCIGCKGCAIDCPSEVDMAKLKAEVTHEYHQQNGSSVRDRLFARVHDLSALGSKAAPLSNIVPRIPGARWLMEQTLGIAADRPLPTFHSKTLQTWFDERGGTTVEESDAARRALLYPDTFTNFSNPAAGKAAVRVLEAANVCVTMSTDLGDTGRPAFSKGFLDRARETARVNVADLSTAVEDGWDVVVIEPSDAVMIQSDYRDLLPGERTDLVANNTYGICEYLNRFSLDEAVDFGRPDHGPLTYHGHCHQKAMATDHHAVAVLERAGYRVDRLDSGCCGMAGSFGYEAEHSSMSAAIGSILYDQVEESDGDAVAAPGASCRTQLTAGPNRTPLTTPIEALADALE